MAYSNFTLTDIRKTLHTGITARAGVFSESPQRRVSDELQTTLQLQIPLAVNIGTEKARSELIITPILIELYKQANAEISLFSGVDFTVDLALGLNGVCDFLISRSRQQLVVESPVVAIIEAKKDDLKSGLPQCMAAMIAARIFNEREQNSVKNVFGVVTTGSLWQFLQLQKDFVEVDSHEYPVSELEKVFGILWQMTTT